MSRGQRNVTSFISACLRVQSEADSWRKSLVFIYDESCQVVGDVVESFLFTFKFQNFDIFYYRKL